MNIDAYIEIPPGTEMSYDLQAADDQVEIQIGSTIGRGDTSTLRLVITDPDTLTDLAKVALEARKELVEQMRRQLAAAALDGDRTAKTVQRVIFPTGDRGRLDGPPVFGTFDQVEGRED
jgi:hypothetical protein